MCMYIECEQYKGGGRKLKSSETAAKGRYHERKRNTLTAISGREETSMITYMLSVARKQQRDIHKVYQQKASKKTI